MAKSKHLSILMFLFIIVVGITFSLPNPPRVYSADSNGSYVGAATCGQVGCHTDIYEGWNQTNHAVAVAFKENASGNFYSVGSSYNDPGPPPESRWRSESSFRASCRNCHTTGGNDFDPLGATNQTWPEMTTDPAKFLNIQCEVCHGAYQDHGPTNPAMDIDYSAMLCELCHVPGSSHDNSYWQSAHADSMPDLLGSDHAADYCLSCMSTQGSLGLDVTLDTADLASVSCAACHDPHSHTYDAQMRFESSTELCGQCHGQAELFENSAHSLAELECTSCHGQGTHFAHDRESAVVNHTWGLFGMFYPYNQSISEEPIVCSSCHTQSWATTQLGVIQGVTAGIITNVTKSIGNAKASIDVANQTSGANQTQLNAALSMIDEAEDLLHDLERDGSTGFHNPEQSFAMLGEAAHLSNEAQLLAFESIASEKTALETQVSSLEAQVTSLQNQTDTLQTDIEGLETKIDDLESAAATVPYLYGGLGLAVGFIIGAAILFVARRGKQ